MMCRLLFTPRTFGTVIYNTHGHKLRFPPSGGGRGGREEGRGGRGRGRGGGEREDKKVQFMTECGIFVNVIIPADETS